MPYYQSGSEYMGIDTFNQNFYKKSYVAQDYVKNYNFIWPEEKLIFEKYKDWIHGKKVLDIGIGGGRTAPALSDLAKDYTGIDYSKEMVAVCKKKYSTLKFIHCDSSDMSMMDNEIFDFVIFSFNGIDSMSHEKRIKTLNEVCRILKRNGIFVFSSHNRDDRKIVTAYNQYDKRIIHNIQNILSYLKVKRHQIITDNYAILSDPLNGFRCLTYYIRKKNQVEQLENVGFTDIEILNRKLRFVTADSVDQESQFIHYIAKKSDP